MSVLVVGSIAIDTVKTPVEEHSDLLGGSASYAALGASFFSPVRLVGIVGNDFPESEFQFWKSRKIDSEGVHVGQEDDSVLLARQKAGRDLIVGKSTHNLVQALAAQGEGADYIGFGPIFATPTKPDYKPIGLSDIRQVHLDVGVPIFCIGGINIDNLQQVIDAGAKRVVMVSALLKALSLVDYARCATDMLA